MKLTLEDIGRLAGVSRSTVSRVINGHDSVRPEIRAKVEHIIESTGYVPNVAARSLVSNRTDVLGLVIPSRVHSLFADPYFGNLIQGISAAANRAAVTVALFVFQDAKEEETLYPRVVRSGLVDGVILTATRMEDPLLRRMTDSDLPVVVVGRPDVDDVSYVDADNRGGGRLAAEHLCGHGFDRIAFISAPLNTTAGVDRYTGFTEGLRACGRTLPEALVAAGDFSEDGGYRAMRSLLPHRPEAVFAASDTMAVGALRALEEAGLAVPDDIALLGFDGLPHAERTRPPLSTVRQPVAETGARAVEILLGILDGELDAPAVETMPVAFVPRASCGHPTGAAP